MYPIDPETSPSYILELIYRLKVKDVMTSKLITAEKEVSLRQIQKLMRENKISGIPVVDADRLVGMISVDDIIRALDQGYIESAAEMHMSRKVQVLEDDMPLSFAISTFEKYKFGRFPVLDREKDLVGIVTNRDITMGLLVEMNKAVEKLENSINEKKPPQRPNHWEKEYLVRQFDYENAGRGSTEIKRTLGERGIDRKTLRAIAVASYELEMNLVNHSLGGRLICTLTPECVTIETVDKGPGIPDLEKALTEGWSTANDWIRSLGFGAGMGLPNTKRMADEFFIDSSPSGTHVKVIVFLDKGIAHENL